jgi:stage V sporulation protein SpoVS
MAEWKVTARTGQLLSKPGGVALPGLAHHQHLAGPVAAVGPPPHVHLVGHVGEVVLHRVAAGGEGVQELAVLAHGHREAGDEEVVQRGAGAVEAAVAERVAAQDELARGHVDEVGSDLLLAEEPHPAGVALRPADGDRVAGLAEAFALQDHQVGAHGERHRA